MKKAIIRINRLWGDRNQTLGSCIVHDNEGIAIFASLSLERGWRDNESNVSCIPIGAYPMNLEFSAKFNKDLWEIKEVKDRAECKFHSANYWYQLQGCIALGLKLKDLNKDGYRDITSSSNTMLNFHSALEGFDEVILVVEDER